MPRRCLIAVLVLVIVAACAGAVGIRLGAGDEAIRPAGGAAQAIAPLSSVPYYLQNDPAWGSLTLGGSREKMANAGCTVCCIAMGLSALGHPVDPGQVCSQLGSAGGFTESGQVIWSGVAAITSGAVSVGLPVNDYATIDGELSHGRPVIAKIMLSASVPHWVLIVGKEGQEYLVMDPLDQDQDLVKLSQRANAIEAIRVFRTN